MPDEITIKNAVNQLQLIALKYGTIKAVNQLIRSEFPHWLSN